MASPPVASYLSTRRGKLTLLLLCFVAFLDFVDASIVNVALPSIRHDLHISVQNVQWVLSGYLLTYGGFMLLGGRAADLLGRRRVLVSGTVVFAVASLAAGLAGNEAAVVGARLAQGVGAAMMLPAALSLVTTIFSEGTDRTKALGAWGAMAGVASAAGVLLGGVLTQGPGWRWVFFVNPLICVGVVAGTFLLIDGERRQRDWPTSTWSVPSSRRRECSCSSTRSFALRFSDGVRRPRLQNSLERSSFCRCSSSTKCGPSIRSCRCRSSRSRASALPMPPNSSPSPASCPPSSSSLSTCRMSWGTRHCEPGSRICP